MKKINWSKWIIIFFSFTILFFAFLVFRGIQTEEFCSQKAKELTGDKATTTVEPTEEEKQRFPGTSTIKISFWYREYLKCFERQRLFYFF